MRRVNGVKVPQGMASQAARTGHKADLNDRCLSESLICVLQSKVTPSLAANTLFSGGNEWRATHPPLSVLPKHTFVWSEDNKNKAKQNKNTLLVSLLSSYISFPDIFFFFVLVQNKFSKCKEEEEIFHLEIGFWLGRNELIETWQATYFRKHRAASRTLCESQPLKTFLGLSCCKISPDKSKQNS